MSMATASEVLSIVGAIGIFLTALNAYHGYCHYSYHVLH